MKQLLPFKYQALVAVVIVALIVIFQTQLDINEHFAAHYEDIGDRYYSEDERYDLALINYQRALSYDDEDAKVHFRLGDSQLRMGNTQRAIAHIQRALDLDYERPVEAYTRLGWAQYNIAAYDAAAASFNTALELVFERNTLFTIEDAASAFSGLGWSVYNVSGCELALPYFQEAAKLTPDMDTVRQGLRLCR